MRANRWFCAIALAYLLIYLAHALSLQKTVYGDGVFYFSWVRSLVVDRDATFSDEYAHFGVAAAGNKHPLGAPLLWLPWYAQAYAILGGTGYELPYQLTVGAVSVLAALAGLALLYRLLRLSFGERASVLATQSVALSTNLLFYGAVDPVNSHAISFFAATVFLSFLAAKPSRPLLLCCSAGFAALVRPQDAILGLLAMRIRSVAALTVLLILFTLWTSPYLAAGEGFRVWPNHILDVLFSPTNGLFVWTPVTLVAAMGLPFSRPWFLAVFAAEAATVGAWSTWWQGASYSGRMLVSSLPLLAFGLAKFYATLIARGMRPAHISLSIVGPLAVVNALLILRFLLQM